MGNCLGKSEKNRSSEEFQVLPTLQSSVKEQWLRCLKSEKIDYHQGNYLSQKYDHPSFEQIKKDISRTFPNEEQFQLEENKRIFKEALQEITLYFPNSGYVQGLNFVVGSFILSEMDQLQTIKSFISCMTHPKLMLLGLYEDDFPLARFNCELFWSLFHQRSPKLAAKVEELNLPDQLWIFQWFICLFIYSFPRLHAKSILSFIWEHKEFACVKMALAIMQILEPTLMDDEGRFQDLFIESMELLKSEDYVTEYLPIKKLIKRAKKIDDGLVHQHISTLKIDNWYRRYFQANELDKMALYKEFEDLCEDNRKKYYKLKKSGGKSSGNQRSMTIIDYIEQLRKQKINRVIFRSVHQKVVSSSFAKFQKRYSYSEQPSSPTHTLVQSVYHK